MQKSAYVNHPVQIEMNMNNFYVIKKFAFQTKHHGTIIGEPHPEGTILKVQCKDFILASYRDQVNLTKYSSRKYHVSAEEFLKTPRRKIPGAGF